MRLTAEMAVVVLLIAGWRLDDYYHQPGGPYYFKRGVTYQGYRPNEQITKAEADSLAADGYAYYVAFFNSDGLPTNVKKVLKGKVEFTADLTWTNRKPVSSRVTDADGKVTESFFDEQGRPRNPQQQGGGDSPAAARSAQPTPSTLYDVVSSIGG